MSATVTNQDLGVTTKTSDHTALTDGPTDVCFDPPKKIPVPHVNHVTTDRAVEHTTGKTLFQGGNVVRVGEAITPSDPAHGDSGGGVVSGTYRAEARATSGSPNVRAEGKPPARTDDPTTQNHANTTGKMVQVVPPGALDDNPEDFYARCSYDTSLIKCGHLEFVDKKQIDIWRADTIIIEAKRKNAKEPGKDPSCVQMPHMKWLVTRSGGMNAAGAALPDMSAEFTGDTLTLDGEWTAPSGTLSYDGNQERNLSPDAQRYYIDQKNRFAQSNATIRGSQRVENQDGRLAYQQVRERIDETDRHHSRQLNAARQTAQTLLNLAQFLVAWRAQQNPVRVAITGSACSGTVSYEVHCYPSSTYKFKVPLDGLIALGRAISRAFTVIRSVGQLANMPVENSLQCPGTNLDIGVEFQWKEFYGTSGGAPEPYTIVRDAECSLGGTVLKWSFEASCPLTNFLAIIPVLGAVAARAIGWILRKLGTDASIGFNVSLEIKLNAVIQVRWSKATGWEFTGAGVRVPIDFKFYLFARIRLRDWVHIEGQAVVNADPSLMILGTPTGVVVKAPEFWVSVGFAGMIHIDTWFYSFHESGTWYPESWSNRVGSLFEWNVIGN
ncbi:PAAR-like domain-containing protein [Chondromyces crocatus]|uniref:Uncharacterized protein n=1 Tax=Chondromyces crocatus TaxID=52 RepID=A0A0K1EIW8_CHOCO|nr:PAAR-like domain-containing protein [Chondromyces crocatus]AKT40607.1 uncharacterized protein CMC5_047630 [Chondromyces crocatus]